MSGESNETKKNAQPLCGLRKPGGTSTCTDPAGHAGSHGDGSVIRWIYRMPEGDLR